jgi:hypothetical protein
MDFHFIYMLSQFYVPGPFILNNKSLKNSVLDHLLCYNTAEVYLVWRILVN